jgi:hypothetical protein
MDQVTVTARQKEALEAIAAHPHGYSIHEGKVSARVLALLVGRKLVQSNDDGLYYVTELGKDASGDLSPRFKVVSQSGNDCSADAFVLFPDDDPHARIALRAYAISVRKQYPEMSKALKSWLRNIEGR